jgi:uncharacterized protein
MIRRSVHLLLAVLIAFLVQGCATLAPVTNTPIFAVQGEGHISPLVGTEVTVRGVVTAVVTRERDAGFFVQDPRGDGNPRTSDALFVDMASRPAEELPSIGDSVEVIGTVEERGRENQLSVTLIANPVVQTLRRGDPLPAPIAIGRGGRAIPKGSVSSEGMRVTVPETHAIDFWESLEGMLVEVREAVVTGPTSSYGDLVVIGDGGPDPARRTAAGGVILREDDLNLDRVVIDGRIATPSPAAKVGDRFGSALRGVVHYDFGAPRVLPVAWPSIASGDTAPEVTELVSGERELTVAAYNVLNLSFTSHERRFADVARTIAVNLRSPDVIGLQEIQDDSGPNRESDGVVSAERTLGRLAEAIAAAGGARYQWAQIDPEVDRDGGQPGGNIRVVWMYRPDRVTLVRRGSAGPADATAAAEIDGRLGLTLTPGRIEPRHPCVDNDEGEGSRKPLAAEFRFRDETIFMVNNHFVSKSSDDRIFGSIQPPRRGSEPQRICQAEILREFTRSMLAVDSRANVIVLGDMNEHEFRAPSRILGEELVALMLRIPESRRYTYNFEGNSQVLDQIFASKALVERSRPEIDVVHVNADFPARSAASDHDPVIARFRFD